jgi:hypothetical protein
MDDAGVMVVVGAPEGHVVSGVVDVALAAPPNPPQVECSRRPDHDGMRRRLFLVNDAMRHLRVLINSYSDDPLSLAKINERMQVLSDDVRMLGEIVPCTVCFVR